MSDDMETTDVQDFVLIRGWKYPINETFFIGFDQLRLEFFPEGITSLVNLKRLSLCGNSITQIPEEIGNLVMLERLHLGSNHIYSLPESFSQLVNLKELTLSENRFEDFPLVLTSLKQLKTLDLHSNQISFIPREIERMEEIEVINMAKNNFEAVPEELGNLKMLKHFFPVLGFPYSEPYIAVYNSEGEIREIPWKTLKDKSRLVKACKK